MSMNSNEDDPTLAKLESGCSDLKNLLHASSNMEMSLTKIDEKFFTIKDTLTVASRRVAPLQTLSIATKALDSRINRAVSPALALLDSFKLFESLQSKLIELSSKLAGNKIPEKRVKLLLEFVECVDNLNVAINMISQEGEPAIQRLQEVVEFLSRTKATDQYRTHRLKETLITLKVLYETEVDAIKFDGLLDEALLNLQDEYEYSLQLLKHTNIGKVANGGSDDDSVVEVGAPLDLGSEEEIEVLRRISEALAANDCLDICIDIFVKVLRHYFDFIKLVFWEIDHVLPN